MITLPPALHNFFAKMNLGQIDFSKDGLSKLFVKKDVDPSDTETPVIKKESTLPAFKLPKGLALDIRLNEAGRYLSGNVFEKAMMTLDKSTLAILAVVWVVAIITLGLAFVSVKEVAQLKLKVETAQALDPILPKVARMPLNKEHYMPLLERLKQQFPTIKVDITRKPSLVFQSNNPDEFINWMNAITYTDSMVSTIRWTIDYFCVGTECGEPGIMQAELSAETINITKPEGF